jgi:hypothetical protein
MMLGEGGCCNTALGSEANRRVIRSSLWRLRMSNFSLLHGDEKVEGRLLSSLVRPFHPNDVFARLLERMLRSCVAFFVFLDTTPVGLRRHQCAAVSEVPGFVPERRPARSHQKCDRLAGAHVESGPVGGVDRGR